MPRTLEGKTEWGIFTCCNVRPRLNSSRGMNALEGVLAGVWRPTKLPVLPLDWISALYLAMPKVVVWAVSLFISCSQSESIFKAYVGLWFALRAVWCPLAPACPSLSMCVEWLWCLEWDWRQCSVSMSQLLPYSENRVKALMLSSSVADRVQVPNPEMLGFCLMPSDTNWLTSCSFQAVLGELYTEQMMKQGSTVFEVSISHLMLFLDLSSILTITCIWL